MLKSMTTATEVAMLLYWVLAGALVLGLVSIDPALMYSDYQDPRVIAWNWSFFPIDIAFAGIGLVARFGVSSGVLRFKLELTAAVLMFCAGLMALSYWVLTSDFDLTWWSMNVWLVVLGAANLMCAQLTPTHQT
ncbi:YvaD family protein [Octadecabacter sp.]|nr:YvaD family protein [Octadecabacter sp.]